MLRSFLDERGDVSDPNEKVIGVGGAISSLEQWEQLEAKWKNILEHFGVSSLHMKQLAHFRGEYEGWTEEKRREFLSKLMTIAEEYTHGYLIALMLKDVWDTLNESQKSTIGADPYDPCFIAYLVGSVEYAIQVGPEEKVDLIVANRAKYKGRVMYYWDNARNSSDAPQEFAERMGDISVKSPIEAIPLQIADLVVYECAKHWRSLMNTHEETGEWKWNERVPFSRIKPRILYNTFFDREELRTRFGIS